MLENQTLAERLKKAMAEHDPPVHPAALARACGVTTAAVGGWLKTGRVDKRHFQTFVRVLGQPLEYFHLATLNTAPNAAERAAAYEVDKHLQCVQTAWNSLLPEEQVELCRLAVGKARHNLSVLRKLQPERTDTAAALAKLDKLDP